MKTSIIALLISSGLLMTGCSTTTSTTSDTTTDTTSDAETAAYNAGCLAAVAYSALSDELPTGTEEFVTIAYSILDDAVTEDDEFVGDAIITNLISEATDDATLQTALYAFYTIAKSKLEVQFDADLNITQATLLVSFMEGVSDTLVFCKSVPEANAVGICIGLNSVDPDFYPGDWSGELSDCELDADRMTAAWRDLGVPTLTLKTKQATRQNCIAAVKAAVGQLDDGGRLYLHISGHGGQEVDFDGDETDGLDEYMCLYDGGLSDDVVHAMLDACTKHIQILWICDTCNSGTMMRAAKPVDLREAAVPLMFPGELILIAGCNEGDTSQSTGHGGVCTLSCLEAGFNLSPLALFDEASTLAAKQGQIMICNEYGVVTDDFRYSPIFPTEDAQ